MSSGMFVTRARPFAAAAARAGARRAGAERLVVYQVGDDGPLSLNYAVLG